MLRALILSAGLDSVKPSEMVWKDFIVPVTTSGIAGATWGLNQVLTHHYGAFAQRHPNANEQFWNPAMSWRNKYNGGDPDLGRNGKLALFSDAYHITNSVNQTLLFVAGVSIGYKKKKWYWYVVEAGASLLSYALCNTIIYDIRYKQK